MKKIIAALVFLSVLFSLFSCDEYIEGVISPPSGSTGSDGGAEQPPMNNDPSDDFVVSVYADGQPYKPRMAMDVYWSDGFSIHTAPLDENGVARIDGLDGDYRVTLSAVPNEYTYDPNGHVATNDNRSIILDLYTQSILTGSGTGLYDCYNFRKTGVYTAVINNPGDAIFFQYAPETNGVYSIESWIDTRADEVNPYVDVYGGSSQFKYFIQTINDGGPVGSYTVNFVHTVTIADENISQAGQAVYTFAVKAESKTDSYPITVTFAVKRNGGFELPGYDGIYGETSKGGTVIPTFDFSDYNVSDHEYGDNYVLTSPAYHFSGTTYVFDSDLFRLYPKSEGGDGFYHVYDEELYADNNGYGPILYGYVTSNCPFIDRAFNDIEYSNASADALETINAALSIGGWNYKHFIEGYTKLSTMGKINGGTYYCVAECPCHDKSDTLGWACPAERNSDGELIKCSNCHKNCRPCPPELIGKEGYSAYANSDGLVPVTEELRAFFEAYCKKENYFYDGKGYIDSNSFGGKYYQAVDGSAWLFACAYYAEKTP